jgi:hypothetical protein
MRLRQHLLWRHASLFGEPGDCRVARRRRQRDVGVEGVRVLAEVDAAAVTADAAGAQGRRLRGAEQRARLSKAAGGGRALDKFEREDAAFTQRVRDVYHARARAEPARFRIVDSTRPVAEVRAALAAIVAAL